MPAAVSVIRRLEGARPGRRLIDARGRARFAWDEVGRPELEIGRRPVERRMDELIAAVDEALAGAVRAALAARVFRVHERQFACLDRDEHRAGMAVPAGAAAGGDDDLLRHEVDALLGLQLDARLAVDVEQFGVRPARMDGCRENVDARRREREPADDRKQDERTEHHLLSPTHRATSSFAESPSRR